MGKKKYYVINNDEQFIEYIIKVKVNKDKGHTKYTLYRSDNEIWSEHVKGEKIASIKDDGDGLIFSHSNKKLEYSSAEEIRILLNFIQFVEGGLKFTYLEVK